MRRSRRGGWSTCGGTRGVSGAGLAVVGVLEGRAAGLRAESHFRVYLLTVHRSELTTIGHLSDRDRNSVKACVASAFAR